MVTKKRLLMPLLFGAVCTVLLTAVFGRFLIFPDMAHLNRKDPDSTAFMKYREHQWAQNGIPRKASIHWVPLNRISPHLVCAVVVSEDGKFWRHHGFDFAEMKYALRQNMNKKQFKFGASTISQQLVKNLYLKPSKDLYRKAAEAILTWRLERTVSKKRILELYLNVIEWGDGIFGIERAAQHYYHKPAEELSDVESARLVAILPNPIRFNPLAQSHYLDRRTEIILGRMNGKSRTKITATIAPSVVTSDTSAILEADTATISPNAVSDSIQLSDTTTAISLPAN